MKTLTLRLNNNEAEALERLSAILGESKNSLLKTMIATFYEELSFSEVRNNYGLFVESETLIEIDPPEDLPESYLSGCTQHDDFVFEEWVADTEKAYQDSYLNYALKTVVNCYDYALTKTTNEEAKARLEEQRRKVVNLQTKRKKFRKIAKK